MDNNMNLDYSVKAIDLTKTKTPTIKPTIKPTVCLTTINGKLHVSSEIECVTIDRMQSQIDELKNELDDIKLSLQQNKKQRKTKLTLKY